MAIDPRLYENRDVFLETNIFCHLTFKDVRHVPNMCLNLISKWLLDKQDYTSAFSDRKWKLTKNFFVVA